MPCVNSAMDASPTMAAAPLRYGLHESFIKVRTVALTPLQIHQPLFETDQELPRFLVKHFTETVVRAAAQILLLTLDSGTIIEFISTQSD